MKTQHISIHFLKLEIKRFFTILVVFSPSLVAQSQPRPSWRSAPTSWPSPGPLSADSSHNPAGYPDGSSGSRTPDWSTRTRLRLGHSGRLWLVNSQCVSKVDIDSELTASLRSHSVSSPSPPRTLWCSSRQSPYRTPQKPRPPPEKKQKHL